MRHLKARRFHDLRGHNAQRLEQRDPCILGAPLKPDHIDRGLSANWVFATSQSKAFLSEPGTV
jgi:hypothetical protein